MNLFPDISVIVIITYELSGLLLELLDGTLVDTTTFVDQVSGGC